MTLSIEQRCASMILASAALNFCFLGASAVATPLAQDAPATNVAATDLPDAKTIIENALKAMGGRDAVEGIQSSAVKSKVTTVMGEITIESHSHKPEMYLIKQTVPTLGQIIMGSDGETQWLLNPMVGYQLLSDEEAKDIGGQASLHNLVLRFEKEFTDLTTEGKATFADQECFKVRMVDKNGKEQFGFFSIEDHLLAGFDSTRDTAMGPLKVTMRFEDWKRHGSIRMFTRMVIEQQGSETVMELTDIEFNTVSKAVFTLPGEVKRMVEQQRAQKKEQAEAADEAQEPST